jgi:HD-GYP domain-containing protein (c-di-GMP phosphodiesterase class II)
MQSGTKRGPLTDSERERVRLHSYYTERMLRRPAALAGLAAIGAAHHERLDGSGYHRGIRGSDIPLLGRYLAAADVYHALLEDRPHRPAREPKEAANVLRAEVRQGRLERIYAKIGASSHATATLFALQHGMLATLEPVQD